jgi:hypothetical protein
MAEVTNGYARSVKDQAVKGYLISPIGNPYSYTAEVAEAMTKVRSAMKVSFWDKNNPKYDPNWLKEADVVVVLPRNNEFEMDFDTPALRKELGEAMEGNKQIFLAYRSSRGIQFYRTTRRGTNLKGLPNSSEEYGEVVRDIYTKNLGREATGESFEKVIDDSSSMSFTTKLTRDVVDRRLLIALG